MKKKGSRTLLSLVFILLVLLAIALFYLVGKKILERLFLGGPG
ncbi:MAG: hypothetical protein QXG39_00945 [Candidatus Aenigmatarchaeota archaeon]